MWAFLSSGVRGRSWNDLSLKLMNLAPTRMGGGRATSPPPGGSPLAARSAVGERTRGSMSRKPVFSVQQIFSIEDIHAIAGDADIACDAMPTVAVATAVEGPAGAPDKPRGEAEEGQGGDGADEEAAVAPRRRRPFTTIVCHFSEEELLALVPDGRRLPVVVDLPDDLWLYCLRFVDFSTQGRIPSLSRRFLAMSDCQEHWRNVASHRGYTQDARPCGEAAALASGGWREYCKLQSKREITWRSPENLTVRAVPECHRAWAPSILYSEPLGEIITCSLDGTVRTWKDDSASSCSFPCTRVLTTAAGEGFSVLTAAPRLPAIPSTSELIAAGSENGNVHVWWARAPVRRCPGRAVSHARPVPCSPRRLVGEETEQRISLLPTSLDFVQSATWTETGRLVTGGDCGLIQVHALDAQLEGLARPSPPDAVEGEVSSHSLEGHTAAVMGMCCDGRGHLITGSVDHTLRVWDLAKGRTVCTLEGHTRSIHCVTSHSMDAGAPFGLGTHVAISGSRDHSIKVCRGSPPRALPCVCSPLLRNGRCLPGLGLAHAATGGRPRGPLRQRDCAWGVPVAACQWGGVQQGYGRRRGALRG